MATAAAALMARARREVTSHFMSQNAVSADQAVAYEPDRHYKRRQFDRMLDAGAIEEASGGRYWLNLPAYDRWQGDRRKRAKILAGTAVVVAAVAALLV